MNERVTPVQLLLTLGLAPLDAEAAQERLVVVGGAGAAGRRTRRAACHAGAAQHEPQQRAHEGEQDHDGHPAPLRQAAHLVGGGHEGLE